MARKDNKETVSDNRDQNVDVSDTGVTEKSEKERKTSPQDRTQFSDTEHVQHHLDKDPNDPRKREAAKPLPSLDDEDQR